LFQLCEREEPNKAIMSSSSRIRAVLIDLSGTVHIGDTLIPGAADAIQRLRHAGHRVRFLTNTSTKSSTTLLEQLDRLGVVLHHREEELLTSVLATRHYLLQHQLKPFCLMEDTSDLEGVDLSPPHNCVVIGLAPSKLQYSEMNQAFRILLEYPKLIAIHKGNYLRDTDGELSLGPGGFCTALETAANCSAVVMGKPSRDFFESALWADIAASETCMIGDDVLNDIQGAKDAGIGTAILVRTGKYRPRDEEKAPDTITSTCGSIIEAVDFILQSE
jgi:HAD superfamily hydrolase (TIGR01458 family)